MSPHVVAVALVGINHAARTVGYEGKRAYPTDGHAHKHPIQEAEAAERHIRERVVQARAYDEVVLLRYRATNEPPYRFEWVDDAETRQAYRAALLRASREIEARF